MLQLRAIVSGKVQHVGYRSRVVTMARTLDLKGCVRNLDDGRVYVVAEGDQEDLERFCRAIRMEDPLIRVEDIQVHLSSPKGAWDGFYKISGERETDSRLDTATVFLKELIVIVKDGFRETNSRLGSVEGKLESMEGKLDQIVAGQEKIAFKIDAARREIVSEVKELRYGFQEGAVSRLSKKKADWTGQHAEAKPKIHIKPS
ncbi:MAG: acylphosphatase [Methanothrix sp.]|nr:acylphosphatase [Methanothrix sp.]